VSTRRHFLRTVGAAALVSGAGACAARQPGVVAAPATAPPAAASPGLPIRLNANENSFGPGPAARRAMADAIAEANRYPFRTVGDLVDAVATSHRLPSNQVLLANGSAQLLDAISATFTSAGRGVLTAVPTFEMPLLRMRELGRPAVTVRVDDRGRFPLDALAAKAPDAGLVYLCNPNNPTGTVLGGAEVRAFIEGVHRANPDAVILVDEAYHEFVALPAYETMLPVAIADPRVIVTRTFSKIHGMAGLRVGYAVGVASTLAKLRTWVDPDNLNGIGLPAAIAALGDTEHVARTRATNAAERERLRAAFTSAGYDSFDSDANFVMVHVRRDPRSFAAACLAKGVQVARPFPPLLEHARITIGTPDEMARATRVFLEVLAEPPAPSSAWAGALDAARAC
jgi:histidinol-phosphate aminotransferase